LRFGFLRIDDLGKKSFYASGARKAAYAPRILRLINERFPAYSLLRKIRTIFIFRAVLTKYRFTREGFNDMADNSESGKNKNVAGF